MHVIHKTVLGAVALYSLAAPAAICSPSPKPPDIAAIRAQFAAKDAEIAALQQQITVLRAQLKQAGNTITIQSAPAPTDASVPSTDDNYPGAAPPGDSQYSASLPPPPDLTDPSSWPPTISAPAVRPLTIPQYAVAKTLTGLRQQITEYNRCLQRVGENVREGHHVAVLDQRAFKNFNDFLNEGDTVGAKQASDDQKNCFSEEMQVNRDSEKQMARAAGLYAAIAQFPTFSTRYALGKRAIEFGDTTDAMRASGVDKLRKIIPQ